MPNSELANNYFYGSIETLSSVTDLLAGTIADAADMLVSTLLAEQKIICFGEAQSNSISQIFSSQLLSNFQHDRPSFPVINISSDVTTLSAIARDYHQYEIFSKQILTFGQPGDALLALISHKHTGASTQAVQAAHEKNMIVICVRDESHTDPASILTATDIDIVIPKNNSARLTEAQCVIVNSFCALIDNQLFGTEV